MHKQSQTKWNHHRCRRHQRRRRILTTQPINKHIHLHAYFIYVHIYLVLCNILDWFKYCFWFCFCFGSTYCFFKQVIGQKLFAFTLWVILRRPSTQIYGKIENSSEDTLGVGMWKGCAKPFGFAIKYSFAAVAVYITFMGLDNVHCWLYENDYYFSLVSISFWWVEIMRFQTSTSLFLAWK